MSKFSFSDSVEQKFCPKLNVYLPSKMEENFEINAISDSVSKMLSPMNFPSDVYKWMKLNAKPKMVLKLMTVCKYFQHADGFPYLVEKNYCLMPSFASFFFRCLNGALNEKRETNNKLLWIVGNIKIYRGQISTLLRKTAVCDIKKIELNCDPITWDEFKFLTDGKMVEECVIHQTTIVSENGEVVSLEDIFECLPNARVIDIESPFFSLEAAEAKISSKLEKLTLYIPPTNFDIHALFDYMKSHQKIQYTLNGFSKEEIAQNIYIKKMLQEWSPEYKTPKFIGHD